MAPRFRPEPQTSPGPIRTGILLCNLGTPDAPTTAATRRYLAEFLSDQRVVEIPPLVWKPLLHGIILRTRPAKSAAKYQTVWTPEGSPLAVDGCYLLLDVLAGAATLRRGYRYSVRYAAEFHELILCHSTQANHT